MNADGISVLLEGREETVNHLRSPFRFELVMENDGVLGHRRCAQRVMAAGLQALQGQDGATSDAVQAVLNAALEQISSEHTSMRPSVRLSGVYAFCANVRSLPSLPTLEMLFT